jgi:hypothetical protein
MDYDTLVKYVEMRYSTREIAKAEGTSQTNVRYWLEKYGLKTNPDHHDLLPRKKCLTCENIVDALYNLYCASCIERRVYNRVNDGLELEELKTDRSRKARILQERGHRCENCGLTEWLGLPIKLELHHVDGNTDNNSRENLQLLCLNCHSLTPTFRAKNKGSESRRKIYRKKYYHS